MEVQDDAKIENEQEQLSQEEPAAEDKKASLKSSPQPMQEEVIEQPADVDNSNINSENPHLDENQEIQPEQESTEMADGDQNQEEHHEVNEEVYHGIIDSIERVWTTFNQEDQGTLKEDEFITVMRDIAKDKEIIADDKEVDADDEAALFFDSENLKNIFEQIEEAQFDEDGSKMISHTTVVDLVYNVLNTKDSKTE